MNIRHLGNTVSNYFKSTICKFFLKQDRRPKKDVCLAFFFFLLKNFLVWAQISWIWNIRSNYHGFEALKSKWKILWSSYLANDLKFVLCLRDQVIPKVVIQINICDHKKSKKNFFLRLNFVTEHFFVFWSRGTKPLKIHNFLEHMFIIGKIFKSWLRLIIFELHRVIDRLR